MHVANKPHRCTHRIARRTRLCPHRRHSPNSKHSGGNPLQPNTANTTSTRTSTANRAATSTTPSYTTTNHTRSTSYQYKTGTNQQNSHTTTRTGKPRINHTNTYDAAGNLLTTVTKDGKARTLYYDEQGRVARVKLGTANSNAPSVYNYYNEHGQRIFRTEPLTDAAFKTASPTGKLTNQLAGVNFYYNLQNQLVFQKGTGTSNKHSQDAYYFWLGDIPVGVFNNQGVFNIYADHLNTPRQLFAWDDQWAQPTTRAKWQWSYSPFGGNQPTTDVNHYAEEEAQDLQLPTTARNTSANNPVMDLRYPGQFYDHSTGLHQNWMRMYDPQTARYTRADPIGLNGGMNRYAYVGGNALWAVDERGELQVTATILPSGNHKGEYRYTFSFPCDASCVHARENIKKYSKALPFGDWFKRMLNAEEAASTSAGLNDVKDYDDKMACAAYEGALEAAFRDAGYKTGKFSGTGLTREQAEAVMKKMGEVLPDHVKKAYKWNQILDKADTRATTPTSIFSF